MAIRIRGDRVLALGSDDEIGSDGHRLHVPGCLVVPGFQDAHVHPMFGGRFLLNLSLHELGGREEYREALSRYGREHPDRSWIYGAGWDTEHFGPAGPARHELDDVVRDRPVFLFNASVHEAWVNSRALALAGLSRSTPDPPDGRFGRSADGELTGHLVEGAAYRFEALHVPAPTPDERADAIAAGQAQLHSFGVTAWQDAWVTPPTLDAYTALASSGQLTGRVRAALWWERDRGLDQIPEFVDQRAAATRAGLSASTVKIMVDGVMENYSASLLAPYQLSCSEPVSGTLYVSPAMLRDAVIELDRLDFQVHMHTIGDRAVRVALDALEAARAANGSRGNRHHLAHLQLIEPSDVPRFGSLGVAANCQAFWAKSEPAMDELTIPFIGAQRAGWQYPFASLAASGAVLAMGSDWPVSTPNPLAQMEVAVRRTDPTRRSSTPFLPAERLDLPTALRAFTAGSAYLNHDPDGGVLAPGLRADLAVLDRDPFTELRSDDRFSTSIADARVLYTIASGRIVHTR